MTVQNHKKSWRSARLAEHITHGRPSNTKSSCKFAWLVVHFCMAVRLEPRNCARLVVHRTWSHILQFSALLNFSRQGKLGHLFYIILSNFREHFAEAIWEGDFKRLFCIKLCGLMNFQDVIIGVNFNLLLCPLLFCYYFSCFSYSSMLIELGFAIVIFNMSRG